MPSFVVGAGAELSLDLFNQAFFSVDFSATSITFAYLDPLNVGTMGLGAGETVTFTGFDEAIVGVGLTTAGVTDLDASDLSFTSNTLSINLDSGAFYSPGATFVVTVQGKAVPLPATMPLVGLALAGLALNRRRKP